MTNSLKLKFEDYSLFHLNAKNRLTHYLGIPLIALSLIGLLSKISFQSINLGQILCLFAFIFYFKLDKKIAVLFSIILILFYAIGLYLTIPQIILFQMSGWVLQFIGHLVYEKKSPAFLKNLEHVLIGPLWIFAKLIRYN